MSNSQFSRGAAGFPGGGDPSQYEARRGFTLVELLVVIGIISILIAILLPALNRARDSALTAACGSNMRQIYLSLEQYAINNRGYLPGVPVGIDTSPDGKFPWAWPDTLVFSRCLKVGINPKSSLPADVNAFWNSGYPIQKYITRESTSDSDLGVLRCPAWRNNPKGDPWSGAPIPGYGPLANPGRWYHWDYADSSSSNYRKHAKLFAPSWVVIRSAWTLLTEGMNGNGITVNFTKPNIDETWAMRPRHGKDAKYLNYLYSDGHVEYHHYLDYAHDPGVNYKLWPQVP